MFEFIKLAHIKLDDLAKKDKRYEAVTQPLQTLLSLINGEFLTFKNVHQNVLKETNESHQLISKRNEEIIKTLYLEIEHSKELIRQNIVNLQENNEKNHDEINLETKHILESIQKEIKELDTILNEKKHQASAVKAKSIAYIDKLILDIRKQSTESINQIKSSYETDLARINQLYQDNEAEILKQIQIYDQEVESKRNVILTTKNAYREQSDAKYLSVKNDYHQASATFNKSIDSLKKEKEHKLNSAKADYQNAIVPINEDLKEYEQAFLTKKQLIESEYQSKLQNQKDLIIEITDDYNQKKNHKIKETSESITLMNSKLSAFRENVAKDRQEMLQVYKENVLLATTEDEKKNLNKEKNKALRAQDNELNKQINRTLKDTHAKTKEQYIYLSELEAQFLAKKTAWRIDGKILVVNYKLSNLNNDLNHQYHLKVIDTKLKTLKQIYDYNVDIIEQTYLEGIAPQEYILSIANAISERDVNLLSNDTNYHLNHYQLQEDTLDYDLQIAHFNQNEKLDIEKLSLEHEMNLLDIKLQLLIDKENVIREQQLKNQNHKKELVLLTYDLTVSQEDLTYLLSKAHLSNQMDYQLKRQQSTKDYYDKDLAFDIEHLKLEKSFLDEQIHFNERVERVNSEIEMLSKDLNVIHSRIHYLFNQIYVIYNIHHRFMLEMINLYQLPAHPEDVKYFITLYLEVFKYLRQIQEYAKDEFQTDMKLYHETKINDLTNARLKTSTDQLQLELKDKLKNLDDEMLYIDKHITKLEDQIFVLSTNVDRIQSDINTLEQNKDEDSKKLSRQQQSDKEILLRQINALESEINILDKSVGKSQNELDKIAHQKEMLHAQFEKNKKNLQTKLQSHASNYLDHLSFYQIVMKKLTKLFLNYESKVTPLTQKLNQPIYITDNVMKEYQKSYSKIEDFFEKQSHIHYQSLLKGSMKLFDSMVKEQNDTKAHLTKNQDFITAKYDKQKTLITQQKQDLKSKQTDYQVTLSKEEMVVLENIKLGIHRDKHRLMTGLKDSIAMTEKQIMTTEQRLNNEMTLIDANLNSVISQMEADFMKSKTKLEDSYKKNALKSLEQITLKQKALKQLEETTQIKNKLIQTKFAQNENKLSEMLKDKQNNFQQNKDKKTSIHQKKIEEFNIEIKNFDEKTQSGLMSNQKKYQLAAEKIQSFEQSLYQKELKDSKKSYAYKQRTLKL